MKSHASKSTQALFFFSFLLPALAYWDEVANQSGPISWFERLEPRYNAGRGQGRGPFTKIGECRPSPFNSQTEPLAGAIVWNRPNEAATLALAFYADPACGEALKTAAGRNPMVVMVLDKRMLRGLHSVSFKGLDTGTYRDRPRIREVRTKALKAMRVEDEVKEGGVLSGIPIQDLPGALVFWDTKGRRHVKKSGVQWLNGVRYEKLEGASTANLLLREVIERLVNLPKPTPPKAVENILKLEGFLNAQVGVPGDRLVFPPPSDWANYALPIDDNYGPGSNEMLAANNGQVQGLMISPTIVNINAASERSEAIGNQENPALGGPEPQHRNISPTEPNYRPQLPENPPNQGYTLWDDSVEMADSLRRALKAIEQEMNQGVPLIPLDHVRYKNIRESFNRAEDIQKSQWMKHYEKIERTNLVKVLLAREFYARWRERIAGVQPGTFAPLPPWGTLKSDKLAPGLEQTFLKAPDKDKDLWLKTTESREKFNLKFFQFGLKLYRDWLAKNPNAQKTQSKSISAPQQSEPTPTRPVDLSAIDTATVAREPRDAWPSNILKGALPLGAGSDTRSQTSQPERTEVEVDGVSRESSESRPAKNFPLPSNPGKIMSYQPTVQRPEQSPNLQRGYSWTPPPNFGGITINSRPIPDGTVVNGQFNPYKPASTESERTISNSNRSPISEEVASNPRTRPPPTSTGQQPVLPDISPENIQRILQQNINLPNIIRQNIPQGLPPEFVENLEKIFSESLQRSLHQTLGSDAPVSDVLDISNTRPVLPITPPQLASNPRLVPLNQNPRPAPQNPNARPQVPATKPKTKGKTNTNTTAKPKGRNPPGRPRKLLDPMPEGIDIYAAPEEEKSPEVVRPVFRLSELGISQKKTPQAAQQSNFESIPLSFSQNIPQGFPSNFPVDFLQNIPGYPEFPQTLPQDIPPNIPQNIPQNEPQSDLQTVPETQELPQSFPIRLVKGLRGDPTIGQSLPENTVQNLSENNLPNQRLSEEFSQPPVSRAGPTANDIAPRLGMWNVIQPALENFEPRIMESLSRTQYSDGSRMVAPSTVTSDRIEIEQQPGPILSGRPASEVLNEGVLGQPPQRQDTRYPAGQGVAGRPSYNQEPDIRRSRQVLETIRNNNFESDESLEPGPRSRIRTEVDRSDSIYTGGGPSIQHSYQIPTGNPTAQSPGNGRQVQISNFALNIVPTRQQNQPGDRPAPHLSLNYNL
ncbi:hypothetical protein TWF694_001108 [Orbilia ellipsospora]|uniref:Uncharacterized protein n=1 Tax=Orbilia ellipsospora TaxID=2528407 RepID=A0AAV9XX97_9PEZI